MNPRQLVKRNPFRGLRPFGPDEHNLFFGRDAITERLVKRLLSRRIVSISGDMGVGKTSIVLAGVWPYLQSADSENNWAQITVLPGEDPLSKFSKALASCFAPYNQEYEEEELGFYIYNSLFSSEEGIVKIIEEFFIETGQNLLIFIDQFEDTLKVLSGSNPESEIYNSVSRFLDALYTLKSRKDFPVYTIIATQTPFFNYCRNFPGMANLMEKAKLNVPAVNRNELKIILEGLLSKSGLLVNSGLKEALYKDAVQQQFPLGTLVLTLSRLWQYWSHASENKKLDEQDYERAGRLNHIFEITGEEAIENLDSYYLQVVAEKIFKGLTEVNSNGMKFKRSLEFGKLCELVKVDPEEIKAVIRVFGTQECSILSPGIKDPIREETQITLFSDGVIYGWQRISNWAIEEAESARIYLSLAKDSELFWKGKAELWKGDKLIAGNKWYEDNSINSVWAERYHPEFFQAIEFLNLSKEKFEEIGAKKANKKIIRIARAKRIRVIAAASFAGLIFAASLILTFSFFSTNESITSSEPLNISIQKVEQALAHTEEPNVIEETKGVLARESYDLEELKQWAKNEVLKQAESGSVAGLPLSKKESNPYLSKTKSLNDLPLALEERPSQSAKIGEISLENLTSQAPTKKKEEVAARPKEIDGKTIQGTASKNTLFRDYSEVVSSLETGFSPQNEMPTKDVSIAEPKITPVKKTYQRPEKPLIFLPDPNLLWKGGEPIIFALAEESDIKNQEQIFSKDEFTLTENSIAAIGKTSSISPNEGNNAFQDYIPVIEAPVENVTEVEVSLNNTTNNSTTGFKPEPVIGQQKVIQVENDVPQDLAEALEALNFSGADPHDSNLYLNSFQTLLKYNGKDYSSRLSGQIRDISVSSNGNRMAAGTDNGEIRFFSLNKGKLLKGQKILLENTQVRSLAWSPDNKILAVGTGSGELVLFEKVDGKFEEVNRQATGKAIQNVRFLKGKQNYFMVINDVNTLHLVTYRYSIVEITESIPHSFIRSMETGNDQHTVLVGESGSCKLYRFDEAGVSLGSPVTFGMQNQVSSISLNDNMSFLAAGMKDGNLCLVKLNSAGEEVERKTIKIGQSQISGLDFFGNGADSQIAVSSYDQTLRLIQFSEAFSAGDATFLVLTGHEAPLSRVKYCLGGQYLITSGKNGEVKLWPAGMNIISRDIKDKYQLNDKSLSYSR